MIGLSGILIRLGLLIWLAFRGWSVLMLAPFAALIAALFPREPLLAHRTQTFMVSAAGFLAQFFPLFLLGALFGKTDGRQRFGHRDRSLHDGKARRTAGIPAVVLAGALLTHGGVSLFVALFVLAPMAQELFRAAGIPKRLMPAAIVLGTSTFTMSKAGIAATTAPKPTRLARLTAGSTAALAPASMVVRKWAIADG